MYENRNRRKFNIKFEWPSFNFATNTIFKIIIRFIAICILFFLIIFCFSRFNNRSKELTPTEFNTNITYIKSNLLKYYNSHNIPKNIDDSLSFSLEELVDKKIIKESKIENYETCDKTDSYATLTKTRDKLYTLNIHIVCDEIVEEESSNIKL